MKSGSRAPDDVAASQYDRIFREECARTYPEIDRFESVYPRVISKARLEAAARILACPYKVNPPCWQHGRLIYATLSSYLAMRADNSDPIRCVDIGTAKGFSALMMQYAILDAGALEKSYVMSVDVIDPSARVRRNTVLEPLEGRWLSLYETCLDNFKEAGYIRFTQGEGVDLVKSLPRINFAFVDGKHDFAAVANETFHISKNSVAGDIVIWDDLQIPGVHKAVNKFKDVYHLDFIGSRAGRKYCVGIRK